VSPGSSPASSDPTASGSGGLGAGTATSSSPAGATGLAQGPSALVDQKRSPLEFVLPVLIAGIPIAVIVLVVILQMAGGAAWLPVVRRWLDRRLIPGPWRRPPL